MRRAWWHRRGMSRVEKQFQQAVDSHILSIVVSGLPCVLSHHEEHSCFGPVREIESLPMCHDARLYFEVIGKDTFELRWGVNLEAEVAYLQRVYRRG